MLVDLFREYFFEENGLLYWRKTAGCRGIVGNRAGNLNQNGYWMVTLKRKSYLAHRVVFAIHHGFLPPIVDHIDRNPLNNIIENLREASADSNRHNSSLPSNNSTGIKGVRKVRGDKFEARVAANNISYQVGTFNTLSEAEDAVVKFREHLHGEFCCHG